MASTTADATRNLNSLVDSAANLVQQLQSALIEIQKATAPYKAEAAAVEHKNATGAPTDPLSLARDSATLIRAHATKLSLLVISEPFTPSAITTVIKELVSGPVTGIATAVQLCEAKSYTRVMQQELLWRSQQLYVGLLDLLQKIPRDGKVLSGSAKEGSAKGGKGSLASTGVLWSACDAVIELAEKGVAGFYVRKVAEWRDTLCDVMEELKEWGEEEDDDDNGEDSDDGEDGELAEQMDKTHLSAQAMVDDFMDGSNAIPRNDPDNIRPRLETALRRLRLGTILCMAVNKRRMKKLPKGALDEATIARISDATSKLQQLPDEFGDLAAAFYDLDAEEIDEVMRKCGETAVETAEVLRLGWGGEEDEFTEWMEKFKVEMAKDTADE